MTHFPTRSKLTALAALAAVAVGGSAVAQPKIEGRSAVLQSLLDCKTKTDPTERLACYDTAAGVIDTAEQKGDIVVVDREQAQAARKQAFGLSLPTLDMFNKAAATPEEANRVEDTVERAYRGGDGKWVFELAGGAVWQMYNAGDLGRLPKKGSAVEIRKGSVGGFFLSSDGQAGQRAKRLQ
jgi:hypothetical protein